MLEKKIVFENEDFILSETGHDYDFVATIENKTDRPITIGKENSYIVNNIHEVFNIKPNDWIGLFAFDYAVVKAFLGIISLDELEEIIAKMEHE